MPILATKANMEKYQRYNRAVNTRDGGRAVVIVQQPFAYSPNTEERYSATPGDYWHLADDEPLTDSEGDPMILVFEVTRFVDADEYEV